MLPQVDSLPCAQNKGTVFNDNLFGGTYQCSLDVTIGIALKVLIAFLVWYDFFKLVINIPYHVRIGMLVNGNTACCVGNVDSQNSCFNA